MREFPGVVGSLVPARYIASKHYNWFCMFGILVGYLRFLKLGLLDDVDS